MSRAPAETFPPCEFICEEMTARKWSVANLAYRMDWDRERTIDFLTNKIRIDLPISETLAKVFGTSAEFWLRLQASSDVGDKNSPH